MAERPDWQWDEMRQVGTDYADVTEVERYDERMGQFRDLAGEDAAILAELALGPCSNVLEIGTGTGHFAHAALAAGHRVIAADVSAVMLEYAAAKARRLCLSGLTCIHAGFLGLDLPAGSVDAAVSVAALHHLPDAWKLVALRRLYEMLRPGGRFILRDVVFAVEGHDYATGMTRLINELPDTMRVEAVRHVAREYSTFDWLMAAMLERAGFEIVAQQLHRGSLMHYLCRR
ncbi:MAG: class I SAM-dependent methyltransferase [Armatimonadetes bacterium]|nr:class I SAM-dependent methyltransferase [Armatimonadota bacterium]